MHTLLACPIAQGNSTCTCMILQPELRIVFLVRRWHRSSPKDDLLLPDCADNIADFPFDISR